MGISSNSLRCSNLSRVFPARKRGRGRATFPLDFPGKSFYPLRFLTHSSYAMKKTLLSILLILAVLHLGGTARAQSGGVAVLDIDAVARELGIEQTVQNELLTMQNKLNTELQKAQSNLQAQMNGVEQSLSENPTEEERAQLIQTNQQLNAQFNQMKSQAQQNLAQERARKISNFREQLKPHAAAAAKDKGLDVILMKVEPPVYHFTEAVDITEATIAKAKEAGLEVTPPPVEGGESTEGAEESSESGSEASDAESGDE